MSFSEGFFFYFPLASRSCIYFMEKINEETVCTCALNRLFGYEPGTAHALIGIAGSAWGVFNLSESEKLEILGPYSKIAPFLNESEVRKSEEELIRLENQGCSFIAVSNDCYPRLLRECDDAPLGLYYRSETPPSETFNTRPQIAVVGTRDISLYGKEWCRRIVEAMSLAKDKPLIVSGFAYGTDIIAHLAAIECGLPTVAVLPTGIDAVYPTRHRRYEDMILSTPGCAFITDYPPGTEPKPINFIRRNRIIAGTCSGTILIESKIKGGGMITARLASSYDRDLLVLPGRADDARSQGCNLLLKDKMAEPITDTIHFIDILGLGSPSRRKKMCIEDEAAALFGKLLSDNEFKELSSVLGCIRKHRGITLEEICESLCFPYGTVSRYSGMLESEGIIIIDLLQRCCINLKND